MKGGNGLIERWLRLMKGYVRISICGGSYERFLNLCANHQILLWNLQPAQKGYEVNLYRKDFYQLKPLASKCRTRIRITGKYGLPFFLNRNRKRKVFAAGFFGCALFIIFLSRFIWNITLEGNQSITRQTVMEYLSEYGVGYGTWKKDVDCRQLAAELRNHFQDLIWVSVKMQGTRLSVNVQENTDTQIQEERKYEDSDLTADAAGTIIRMITREGTPIVREGDTVSPGDLLVQGRMEITDDSGTVTSYRYCAADADIYIKTDIRYEDEFLLTHEIQEYTGKKRYGIYIGIGKSYWGIDLGIHRMEQADILGKEKTLCLMKDFFLPLSVHIATAKEYRNVMRTYGAQEAKAIAEERLKKFLTENEQKGVQIFENNVRIDISATSCRASGTLTAVKKTGRRVPTEKSDLQREGNSE
ncbi:MAG: sporulation protein YqfD [Eubacteriales bacterium]|nr:sporulation protein YqfD [Eubacteriales bacterium]